jgi:enediyne biosynthesis protein E4
MKHRLLRAFIFFMALMVFHNCSSPDKEQENSDMPLFELLPSQSTNINFTNKIIEGLNTNVLMYEYFYNGAGVAAGDLNNDGLEDLFFTSNMENNALYINKGNMKFEEAATIAGVIGRPGPWKTGVTMADVNGDGLLDLYVCYSGKMAPERLINQLFINLGPGADGIPRFVEQTQEYGLAFPTNTTHAIFFDFDNDGDLDLLILNHHPDSLPKLTEDDTEQVLKIDDSQHGIRLLRNDNGFFTDITIAAGIISSPITYGLGAGIADINMDGWADFYICNDFSLPDYLYINNGDGTFTDRLQEMLGHTSYASMGNNVADINNDGLPDIFSLDMLPEDNRRQKLLLAPNDYDFFDLNVRLGFYYQYLRSMLHLNNGNGTFSEIGQIAGVAATDWSWAPLFADFDNDGWKDLLITNGYLRDYTNLDFLRSMDMFVQQNQRMKREDVLLLVNQMPETELRNYIFKNNGNATFTQINEAWGITETSYTNGAIYVDLDNDGDLDIVTNNINKTAFIYENKSIDINRNNFLKVKLAGDLNNKYGYGAKVYIYYQGRQQLLDHQPAKGYQSSSSQMLHFGLGKIDLLDSVKVIWQRGNYEVRNQVSANQTITFHESKATIKYPYRTIENPIFRESPAPFEFRHFQPVFNDFKRQALMFNAKSFEGPCMVKADVNGDGLEDIFIGGGAGQEAALFINSTDGFNRSSDRIFAEDQACDDVRAVFFDANNDGAPDLYVCSGGYHNFEPDDLRLQDRLYINDGKGGFKKAILPEMRTSTRAVAANDINGDGNIDLIVGGFVVPGRYPEIPESYILINDGKGNFKIETLQVAPELERTGMVTDATWQDLDGDGIAELIVAGLWMPVMVFKNENGVLTNKSPDFFDKPYSGFWNTIHIADLNDDGRPDLIAGNLGENSQMQAKAHEPAELYYKDFDNNGSIDPIICFYIQGRSYPYVTRKELIAQLPRMEQRFPTFEIFADATIGEVFTPDELADANRLIADHAQTSYFEMGPDGKFILKELPIEAQYAPVYSIASFDYNDDGNKDLLLSGNINQARIRFGKYDANYGLLLEGDGNGNFKTIPQHRSGFKLKGDVRSVLMLDDQIIFGINGNEMKFYRK